MASFSVDVDGIAIDLLTATYRVGSPENLIGVEITNLDGRLKEYFVSVFISCGRDGAKAMMTAPHARELADQLTSLAALIESGATSMRTN